MATITPTPTQTIGYYIYQLGSGNTFSLACSNFSGNSFTVYAPISGGSGPNIGEYLYTVAVTPPSVPVGNGFYSNGVAWYQVSGGLGQIVSGDPDGCL